jgi:hypothetical protein
MTKNETFITTGTECATTGPGDLLKDCEDMVERLRQETKYRPEVTIFQYHGVEHLMHELYRLSREFELNFPLVAYTKRGTFGWSWWRRALMWTGGWLIRKAGASTLRDYYK